MKGALQRGHQTQESLEATVKVVYSPPWHDLTLNPSHHILLLGQVSNLTKTPSVSLPATLNVSAIDPGIQS